MAYTYDQLLYNSCYMVDREELIQSMIDERESILDAPRRITDKYKHEQKYINRPINILEFI